MPVSANSLMERERPEYVMPHSLAHALMSEVAIDCGYPASALKERIYVLPRVPGQPIHCGILIYTATAGNQGTLGGLVEVTRRFSGILKSGNRGKFPGERRWRYAGAGRMRLASGGICGPGMPRRAPMKS